MEGSRRMTWDSAPDLLTVKEVAALVRRSPNCVYLRLEKGEWAHQPWAWKEGKDWRIERDPLREYLRKNKAPQRRKAEDPMPKAKVDDFEKQLAQVLGEK